MWLHHSRSEVIEASKLGCLVNMTKLKKSPSLSVTMPRVPSTCGLQAARAKVTRRPQWSQCRVRQRGQERRSVLTDRITQLASRIQVVEVNQAILTWSFANLSRLRSVTSHQAALCSGEAELRSTPSVTVMGRRWRQRAVCWQQSLYCSHLWPGLSLSPSESDVSMSHPLVTAQ